MRSVLLLLVALFAVGCSRELSRDEALRVISTHPLVRPTDNVKVDGISSNSPTEAIVLTTIAGETMNLRLRKFDTGWTWEFAETRAGGWISADVAIGQIREAQRVQRALEFANKHRPEYSATVDTLARFGLATPTPKVGLSFESWMMVRNRFADIAERYKEQPDWQQQVALLRNEKAPDAWGTPFSAAFDSEENTMQIVSSGPDKTKGTGDDLVRLIRWRPVWESGETRWSSSDAWRMPENLGDVVAKLIDKRDTVEYSKAVQP